MSQQQMPLPHSGLPVDLPPPHTRESLLRVLDREIAMRERVYPKLVDEGKMRMSTAQDEIRSMLVIRAIVDQATRRQP